MAGISVRGGAILLAGVLIGAQANGQAPPAARPNAVDQNEVICEKIEVIGSRLATKRVCMTRAEWADARRQDRESLERKQTERGMNSN